ncbi:MAG: 1-deoxy-D-xylulose-5-phosphate reductoisomerase, partial [Mucinivorans sp.]
GAKITVNSATMLNKGFEVMEARWLFGLRAEQIEVVIHPESIIHSFVEFEDGALKAQLGTPDMRLPIQYALTFPYRMEVVGHEQWNPMEPLTFNQVDRLKYPCLGLAYEAMEQGGLMPTVLNAASEVAVGAFLEHRIGYGEIFGVIERAMESFNNEKITTFERIIEVNAAIMGGIKL